jgi:predicted dehydrogenase
MKATAAVGLGAWVTGRGAWADDAATPKSPNERLNIACIGVGGKGDSDSEQAARYGDIVAICDIDDHTLAKKSEKEGFLKSEKFNDFRKMFDKLGKSIDAVTISVPDHNHAVAAMMAIKSGKHVYCQKPLTRTIKEARTLRESARQFNVCTQMGNQGTAHSEFRHAVDLLRGNALGVVKEVHIWTNRPIWPQAPAVMKRPPEVPTPAHIHWDEWIGPAPMRPYAEYEGHKGAYHSFNWRGWWDFGTGALGDMGCHTANMPFMGLELGYPSSIEAKCGDLNDETYPSWATIIYQFPARGDKPPVKLTWWEGHKPDSKDAAKRNLPDNGITRDFTMPNSGSLCIGDKASMFSLHDYGANDKIVLNANGETKSINLDVPQVIPSVPRTATQIAKSSSGNKDYDNDEGQKADWVAAIKAGKRDGALSNFDYAGMLTEFLLLGNIAIKTGKKLEWDGPGMKFKGNNEDADKLIHREYREGYTL